MLLVMLEDEINSISFQQGEWKGLHNLLIYLHFAVNKIFSNRNFWLFGIL